MNHLREADEEVFTKPRAKPKRYFRIGDLDKTPEELEKEKSDWEKGNKLDNKSVEKPTSTISGETKNRYLAYYLNGQPNVIPEGDFTSFLLACSTDEINQLRNKAQEYIRKANEKVNEIKSAYRGVNAGTGAERPGQNVPERYKYGGNVGYFNRGKHELDKWTGLVKNTEVQVKEMDRLMGSVDKAKSTQHTIAKPQVKEPEATKSDMTKPKQKPVSKPSNSGPTDKTKAKQKLATKVKDDKAKSDTKSKTTSPKKSPPKKS